MAEERKKIIVGIDPGVTVGYAILNLDGALITAGATKELALDQLVSRITGIGAVLIVGCDKAKIPDFVASFATKVCAKVVCPDEDLLVDEKRKLAEQMPHNNVHEMDAIASAIFAWKNVEPLFKRIDSVLGKENKMRLSKEVKTAVIKENTSIKSAIKLVEGKNSPFEIKTPMKKEEKMRQITAATSKFSALKEAISRLKQEKHLLSTELSKSKKNVSQLQKRIYLIEKNTAIDERLALRERRITSLNSLLEQKERKIEELRNQNAKLYLLLSKSRENIIMPRLKNLGWQEYSHRIQKFPVHQNDLIFVDDPYSFSQQTIDELRTKNATILSMREAKNDSLVSLGIAIMNVKDVGVELHPTIAIIRKTDIERKRKEKFWVNDIIEEYQEERKNTLKN